MSHTNFRKNSLILLSILLLGLCVAGLWYLFQNTPVPEIKPIAGFSSATASAAEEPSATDNDPPAAVDATEATHETVDVDAGRIDPAELPPNVLETRRMVMAHAPVREPHIENPDSTENQERLQRMVANALNRRSAASR